MTVILQLSISNYEDDNELIICVVKDISDIINNIKNFDEEIRKASLNKRLFIKIINNSSCNSYLCFYGYLREGHYDYDNHEKESLLKISFFKDGNTDYTEDNFNIWEISEEYIKTSFDKLNFIPDF
uniref:Uncharacterized protein n=1 Tax=viral metagenome TaxID=1070528 RepID=A0A6C0AED2_9ZZZZ